MKSEFQRFFYFRQWIAVLWAAMQRLHGILLHLCGIGSKQFWQRFALWITCICSLNGISLNVKQLYNRCFLAQIKQSIFSVSWKGFWKKIKFHFNKFQPINFAIFRQARTHTALHNTFYHFKFHKSISHYLPNLPFLLFPFLNFSIKSN